MDVAAAVGLLEPHLRPERLPLRDGVTQLDTKPYNTADGFSPIVPILVHFGVDVDLYGHVNNVKYFEYFQEARIRYLMRIFDVGGPGERAVPLVIAQMDVDYRVPILFRPEPYDVHSWVSSVGNSSFVIESEIRDGGTLLSRARVVAVTFDAAAQKATPAPAAHRAALLAELARTS